MNTRGGDRLAQALARLPLRRARLREREATECHRIAAGLCDRLGRTIGNLERLLEDEERHEIRDQLLLDRGAHVMVREKVSEIVGGYSADLAVATASRIAAEKETPAPISPRPGLALAST